MGCVCLFPSHEVSSLLQHVCWPNSLHLWKLQPRIQESLHLCFQSEAVYWEKQTLAFPFLFLCAGCWGRVLVRGSLLLTLHCGLGWVEGIRASYIPFIPAFNHGSISAGKPQRPQSMVSFSPRVHFRAEKLTAFSLPLPSRGMSKRVCKAVHKAGRCSYSLLKAADVI